MRAQVLAAVLVLAVHAGSAGAQPVTGVVKPTNHRDVEVKPARGRIDPLSGVATITLRGWNLEPLPASNGVFPDLEHVRMWIGEFNDFNVADGTVQVKGGGTLFSYKAPAGQLRGIERLRIKAMDDGSFRFWVTLKNTSLSELVAANPQCINFTFVIGDDDGFTGISFSRHGPRWFNSRRLFVDESCVPQGGWPGL